jgi:hypothetical protein
MKPDERENMATTAARAEAEKMRIHLLNIALATCNRKDGDLREATEFAIAEFARMLDRFATRTFDPSGPISITAIKPP